MPHAVTALSLAAELDTIRLNALGWLFPSARVPNHEGRSTADKKARLTDAPHGLGP